MMLASQFSLVRFRALTASLLFASMLAACGGGGGGDDPGAAPPTPTTPTAPVVIVDSFGDVVPAGDGGVGVGDSGADGTAGDGAGIANGQILITDATGRTVAATTNSRGYYRAKVTGFTPPFVAKVTAPSGKVYHSVNVNAVRVNGFITLNITSLTDKIASDVAVAAGRNGAAALTPQLVTSAAVNTAVSNMRTQLSTVITTAGLNPATFDPIGNPFRPDLRGHDFVLESVVVTVDATGRTQLAISPEFTPTLAGNWRLTVVEGNETVTLPNLLPAASVPNAVSLLDTTNMIALVPQFFAQDLAAVNGTATITGNTIRVTGTNTNYLLTINSISATNFQSCGACGVNSQIRFVLATSITEEGTFAGVNQPRTTINENIHFTYQRVN